MYVHQWLLRVCVCNLPLNAVCTSFCGPKALWFALQAKATEDWTNIVFMCEDGTVWHMTGLAGTHECLVLGAECEFTAGYDDEEIGSEDGDGWEDDMEDSAEGAGCGDINGRLANRRRGKGTGNPGKPGKKLRLADLQSQFGVGLKVRTLCGLHNLFVQASV